MSWLKITKYVCQKKIYGWLHETCVDFITRDAKENRTHLKKVLRLVSPSGILLTAVIPYAWPFTSPSSVLCSISSSLLALRANFKWSDIIFVHQMITHFFSYSDCGTHECMVLQFLQQCLEEFLFTFRVVLENLILGPQIYHLWNNAACRHYNDTNRIVLWPFIVPEMPLVKSTNASDKFPPSREA